MNDSASKSCIVFNIKFNFAGLVKADAISQCAYNFANIIPITLYERIMVATTTHVGLLFKI